MIRSFANLPGLVLMPLLGALACADAGGPLDLGPVDDGFDSEPGTGLTFVVSHLQVLETDEAVTIADCRTPECQTSLWGSLGNSLNDRLRLGVLSGVSALNIIELAGLTDVERQSGPLTVKTYETVDFDQPVFAANNFRIPPEYPDACCEFTPVPTALQGNPRQARYRARALWENQVVTTTEVLETGHVIALARRDPIERLPIPLEKVSMSGRVSDDGLRLEGQMAGVVSYAALAQTDVFFCPEVLQGCAIDGLDNAAAVIEAAIGPPNVCDDIRGCWGYSVVFAFHAVPAQLRDSANARR